MRSTQIMCKEKACVMHLGTYVTLGDVSARLGVMSLVPVSCRACDHIWQARCGAKCWKMLSGRRQHRHLSTANKQCSKCVPVASTTPCHSVNNRGAIRIAHIHIDITSMTNAKAVASLEGLPRKLLHRICVACVPPDITSLQTVSHALGAVADEHPDGELDIYYLRESVNYSPTLHRSGIMRSMKNLCFHAGRLPHCATYEEWDLRRKPNCGTFPNHSRTHEAMEKNRPRQMANAYDLYRSLHDDESMLASDGAIRDRLSALFTAVPRLDALDSLLKTVATNGGSHGLTKRLW